MLRRINLASGGLSATSGRDEEVSESLAGGVGGDPELYLAVVGGLPYNVCAAYSFAECATTIVARCPRR